ncbi:MAG: hypothetical protein ACTSUE_21855 [Promethearchaeota archaeon]
MFRHKPRVDEIPDFKGFLVFLEQINPELHGRYTAQLKKTIIIEVLMLLFFVTALVFGGLSFFFMFKYGYFTNAIITYLSIFFISLVFVIILSVFGRKGHAGAIRIESEIVVEYHKSGFSGT